MVSTTVLSTSVRWPRPLTWFLAAWAIWLLSLLTTGSFAALPRPALPLTIWTPVIVLAIATWRHAAVAAWAKRLSIRVMVAFHIVRFGFGAWFLALMSRSELDPLFATRAGYGDLVSGGLALIVVAAYPSVRSPWRERIVQAWNIIALADILMVFGTAQYVLFFGAGLPGLMPLVGLPGSFVPTLVVPTILITHFWIAWRRGR